MFTAIDHLVIAVSDLEAAVRAYGAAGFTVVAGGRHDIGTHNALIGFSDGSYLELIAFLNPIPGHPWGAAIGKGGGLVDFCMQTDDLASDAEVLRSAGVPMGERFPMTRDRPDGYRLKWALSIPKAPFNGRFPFLIEDDTPRDERVPRERSHANGVEGLDTLTIAVEDPAATAVPYARVLGRAGTPVRRPDLDGSGVRFAVGPHTIDLIAPQSAEGPLVDWVGLRGASPITARLAGPKGLRLDPASLAGARLSTG